MAEAVAVKPKTKKKTKVKKSKPSAVLEPPGTEEETACTVTSKVAENKPAEAATRPETETEPGDEEIKTIPPDARQVSNPQELEKEVLGTPTPVLADEKDAETESETGLADQEQFVEAREDVTPEITEDTVIRDAETEKEDADSHSGISITTTSTPLDVVDTKQQNPTTSDDVVQSDEFVSLDQSELRLGEELNLEQEHVVPESDAALPCEQENEPGLEAQEEQPEAVPDTAVQSQFPETVEAVAVPTDLPPAGNSGGVTSRQPQPTAPAEESASRTAHRKLYPNLQGIKPMTPLVVTADLQPFTQEQLLSLYFNPQLQQNAEYIDGFLKEVNQDKHEFYELLLNYYRARNHLAGAEHDISVLQKDYEKFQDMVWETQEEKITVQGHCQDKAKVSIEHTYFKVCFNEPACHDVGKTLKEIRSHIQNDLSLYAYEAQLSRLQVESYIHQLYVQNPALRDMPHNLPVTIMMPQERPVSFSQQVETLRTAITILFMFQRKPAKDSIFVKDTRLWLARLVASLLRVATIEDHVYLLNQLLRCPAGVGKWAASYLQVLPLPTAIGQPTWGTAALDHFVTLLATLLMPVKAREDLLYQMRVTMTPTNDNGNDNPWIIVDSDGEEDEDPANSWQYLQENDIVALLAQLPLDVIFRHVLFIDRPWDSESDHYNIQFTSEACMLKLFAFASCLISILGQGLQTYCIGRYRQLNKRLGRMVRHVIQYVSDHWESYKAAFQLQLSPPTMQRLQLEFDTMFLRAALCILSAQRLGSWQFLTNMPYGCLSATMMWRLVWGMHRGCQDMANLQKHISLEECKKQLLDDDNQMWFEDTLTSLPTSEATYLLTTFANMACCRPSEEKEFIEAVTTEIFEIAYMCSHTRDFCSKPGRELLASISLKHPFIISSVLNRVKNSMDKIGMVSLFLFKGLPLFTWQPQSEDIHCLQTWLLTKPMSSPESQLARAITEKMNWGYNEQADELFLDLKLHRWMAVLIVQTYAKHLAGKTIGSLFTEGLRQMASLVRSQLSEDQQMANWAWETLLLLQLHAHLQPRPVLGSPSTAARQFLDVPSLKEDASLYPIVKAIKENFAIASYVALVMTNTGHSITDFCSDGIAQLRVLLEKSHVIPAVKALSCITPIFYRHLDYLTSSEGFMAALQYLFASDQSKKGLIFSEFPGPATKLLSAMIQTQIQVASIPGGVGGPTVIDFWLMILSKMSKWFQDRSVLYVVDNLLKAAFRIPAAQEAVTTFLSLQFKKVLKTYDKDQGMLSSLVTWLSSGSSQPSLIDAQSCPEFAWFTHAVLVMEAKHEEETGLWTAVQQKVYCPNPLPLEQAVKKSASELKLNCSPSGHRLVIYRWANQALDMDMGHPVLPLVWQKFFLLYLGRLVPETGLTKRGSMGERFFDSPANISLLKRMKKRLTETADYYHHLVTETESNRRLERRMSRQASAASSGFSEDEGMSSEDDSVLLDSSTQSRLQFYGTLVRFYQTLSLWLDEPRLHDASLYLPALPPQYDAERLLTVFQCNKEPWLEFVDFEKTDSELGKLVNEWSSQVSHDCHHDYWGNAEPPAEQNKNATERILHRLALHEKAVPPPSIVPLKAPVPEISPALLCDKQNLIFALSSDYTLLVEHAKLFHVRTSHHVGLDCTFVELLPDLFCNELTETVLNMPCRSSFNLAHRCKGPAVVTVRYDEKKRNDIVNRKIGENRAEYKQLLIESQLPPPQAVCGAAVHVENALTNLIKLYKSSGQNTSVRSVAMEVGTSLFYHLSAFVSEDTKIYPPTKQFFSSCIEILGQEFIRNNPTQSQPLLQAILQTPSLVGLLAPNFSPTASPDLFVGMYEDMLPVPYNQGSDVAFSLLSKFDVQMWLQDSNPPISQRSALLELLATAIGNCGKEPEKEFRLVFEVYRAHLGHLLVYRFPDQYGSILKLIIKASAAEQLSPVIWEDFLDGLGCSKELPDLEAVPEPSQGQGQGLPPPYTFAMRELSWNNIKDTMEWMSSYFFRLRVSTADSASFGLYPKWKAYVKSLACFQGFLAHRAVVAMVNSVKAKEKEAELGVKEVWQLIVELFSPWIQPLDNNGHILSPWILNDVDMALSMVKHFVASVSLLYTAFEVYLPAFSMNALSLLWPHHINNIIKPGVPKHVQRAFHNQLVTLPWSKFYPDINAMELMVQVHEAQGKECFRFLAHVVSQMPWAQILENYCHHELMDIVSRMHVCLFTLLVQLGQDENAIKETKVTQLLGQAERFNWNFLDGATYTRTTQWLVDHCDPKCVVAERTANSAQVLSLLKGAASFHAVDSAAWHPETPIKRVAYVRCIIQLLSKCSHLDVKGEAMGVALNNLMTQVETIVGSVVDLHQQREESLSLCIEVLSILNHCNPKGPSGEVLLTTQVEWIESSPSSNLLMPLITASCRCLASVSNMVRLVEGCMDAFFMTDVCDQDSGGWGQLLSVLQIPDLNQDQFLEEGVRQGCYLTLYAYVLQKLPLSQSLADEYIQLKTLIAWNSKAKPTNDNEYKMLLWWGKVLELMLRQVDYGGDIKQLTKALHSFVPTLVTMGEDKSSSGLLGAIGLGKRSQLSSRFRLLAKCLSTYLAAQIPTDNSLRLQPQAPGFLNPPGSPRTPSSPTPATQAVQALSHLDSLKANKQYSGHTETIQYAVGFISSANHCLRDAPRFFIELASTIFPEKNCLAILRVLSGYATQYAVPTSPPKTMVS